ncbi:class I SAM-dependent methyltransferase [Roseofilum casamattae]|uniref:Methyltransferase domain-containing protein n=1 Tax=Roseofilum casamattae BLCC-M143 TaxID=3022442 RepID=A0ABT7C0Z1_9CYAN|nr:class I SAM-dependent methyltransferase [Roseofilum casamattae]MDJ1185109.1 methyltransferase domain-containing protein [Roseofilum casamattae BLCC-M143]
MIEQSWNAKLYEDRHHYVSQMAEDLVTILSPQPEETILDLGCGTGHLAAKIAESGATVIGCDRATSMIEQARTNYPHVLFEVIDGEQLVWKERFDAIFSNAALHWMSNAEAVVQGMSQALKVGGRLVAEFGGKGNISAISTTLRETLATQGYVAPAQLWYFPSISEYSTLLEAYGFEVVFAQLFDRPTPLEGDGGLSNWVTMFASHLLATIPVDKRSQILHEIETKLRPHLYREGTWFADYRRLRLIAYRI